MAAKGSLANFTDLELWCWYAYIYGFRRVQLGAFEKTSPVDPDGTWFNARLAEQAENYYARKFGRSKPQHFLPPSHQDEIRDNCRKIPRDQLTAAEVEFLLPGLEAMTRRVAASLAAADSKWRKAFRPPQSTKYRVPVEPSQVADVTIKDPAFLQAARERMGL